MPESMLASTVVNIASDRVPWSGLGQGVRVRARVRVRVRVGGRVHTVGPRARLYALKGFYRHLPVSSSS